MAPLSQPLRRAGRPDVARRRLRPLGARLPHGRHARSRWPRGSSGTSSTAGCRRRSSRSAWRSPARTRWGSSSTSRRIEYLDRPRRRRADRADLPDRRRARSRGDAGGLLHPRIAPTSRAGSIAILKARQRMAEILRILPGSSLVVAPSDQDLASPEVGGRARGVVRGRRLHGAAALGAAPAGLPITSPRRSTGASRRSSFTPTAASRRGARTAAPATSARHSELANAALKLLERRCCPRSTSKACARRRSRRARPVTRRWQRCGR